MERVSLEATTVKFSVSVLSIIRDWKQKFKRHVAKIENMTKCWRKRKLYIAEQIFIFEMELFAS